MTTNHCITPRAIDAQAAPAPRPARLESESYSIPLLVRDRRDAYAPPFNLRLEVGELLTTYGDGIYTVSLWGQVGSRAAMLGQYAVVVGERARSVAKPQPGRLLVSHPPCCLLAANPMVVRPGSCTRPAPTFPV